jgi:cephalosporin hydroxylase
VTEDNVGLAFELMLTAQSRQQRVWTEGSWWFGVETLQAPLDAAAISKMLYDVRPDLVIEIGTECGGSAVFMGELLRMLGPANLSRPWNHSTSASEGPPPATPEPVVLPRKLVTYDVVPRWRRGCNSRDAIKGPSRKHPTRGAAWRRLLADGIVEPHIADVTSAEELSRLAAYASVAGTVIVIDDGDHFATPLALHFELLAHLVKPVGSFYMVQDTRLDRVCQAGQQLQSRLVGGVRGLPYCRKVSGAFGGPARAVRYLQCESDAFQAAFEVDRSQERWILTQHPGGWLRRVR